MSIVLPRSVWGPRYANGFEVIGTSEWEVAGKEIWLHHSVTYPPGPDATLEQDCAHMREFEQIGENRFGGGISYTWVVMPSGRVFQGHDIDRQGSHTYQRNNRSRAICLAGRYDTNPVPDRMANSVAALLRELGATIDGPHSQVYPTDCPGGNARARIGEINQLAVSGESLEDDDMTPDELMRHEVDLVQSNGTTVKRQVGDILRYSELAELITRGIVQRVEAKVDALTGTLSDDEAKVIAAVRAQPTGGQVDVEALAASLRTSLGDAIADELAQRLGA